MTSTTNDTVARNHAHLRDEQFWFTAAVVGFNTFVIHASATWFRILASAAISILGIHLILTRWLKIAVADGRVTAPPFDNKTARAGDRARYTLWEIRAYSRQFGYVVAEFSGSLFYLSLIVITFVAAVIHKT